MKTVSHAKEQNTSSARGSNEEEPSDQLAGGYKHLTAVNAMEATTRIVIVDSQVLTRDCLARCLKALEPNLVVSAFATLPEWQKAEADHQPPSMVVFCNRANGDTDAERELEVLSRTIPVIVVSHDEDSDQVLLALQSGVRGYIPTSVTFDVAVEAMRLVKAGGTFVPAGSLNSARQKAQSAAAPRTGPFSPRQTEVIEAVRQGKANKVIAYELNMRESTVKVHIRHIMRKLKATNRTQVAYLTNHLFDQKQLRC